MKSDKQSANFINLKTIAYELSMAFDIDKKLKGGQKSRFLSSYGNEKIDKTKVNEYITEQMEQIEKLINFDMDFYQILEVQMDTYLSVIKCFNHIQNVKVQKLVYWSYLKRVLIPIFAYKMALNDYDNPNKLDKNLSGGAFWYLPDIKNNTIEMPMKKVFIWISDLYGDLKKDKLYELFYEFPNNTINSWESNYGTNKYRLPKLKSLKKLLDSEYELMNGIISLDNDLTINEKYNICIDFVRNKKKLTQNLLIDEIPNKSLIKKIYADEDISEDEKEIFIVMILNRWDKPSKEFIFQIFLIARVIGYFFGKLSKYFNLKENVIDFNENKILQLFYHYQGLYNIVIDSLNKTGTTTPNNDSLKYSYEYLGVIRTLFENDKHSGMNSLIEDMILEITLSEKKDYELQNIYELFLNCTDIDRTEDEIEKIVYYIFDWNKNFII